MYADPPNADLLTVCQADSECYLGFKAQMDDMAAQGAHIENDAPYPVTGIHNAVDIGAVSNGQIPTDTIYQVTYTVDSSVVAGATIVDASGKVIYELVPGDNTGEPLTRMLVRTPDDAELPWRYVD